MKIGVPKERRAGENRVAATPETVKKFIGLGFAVAVEKGAGEGAAIPDAHYAEAGATVAASAKAAVGDADIVLKVQRPTADEIGSYAKDALIVAMMAPYAEPAIIAACAAQGVQAAAMEFMPRITRAQTMDVLSSQANLAGYRAVIEAAYAYAQAMPQFMTAAGTIRPAKAFVMGAGVAGLQAIATARRLGAQVSATDVRRAAAEQVASLGAKFVMVETAEDMETAGGYAKELSDADRKRQEELVAEHIKAQDIVVTTALIPGRPAPRLVSKAMVESMKPGSVIVDLAVEAGGNCELSKPDQTVVHNGVSIVGYTNLPSRIAVDASALYSRNLFNFLSAYADKEKKSFALDWEDDIVKAVVLTRGGKVLHPDIRKALESAQPDGTGKTAGTKSGAGGRKATGSASGKAAAKPAGKTSKKAPDSQESGQADKE